MSSKLIKNFPLLIITTIIFINLITLSNCSSEEKSDKQMKFDACYKLVGKKVNQDMSYFKSLSSDQRVIDEIIQNSLFNCYHFITYYDAEEIDTTPMNQIDIDRNEYEEYLSLKKWEELILGGNQQEIAAAREEISDAYIDLQTGQINTKKFSKMNEEMMGENVGNMNGNQNYGKREQMKGGEKEDMNIPSGEKDLVIFGFNFNNLSGNTKNIIGVGLILLIFIAVIGGLKWIQSIRNGGIKNNKKKDKKKKKQN